MGNYVSYFKTGSSLEGFKDHVKFVAEVADAECVKLVVCKWTKRACHGKEGYMLDFFYAYSTVFRDMSVRLTFSDFQMGVLRELNVARPNYTRTGRHSCRHSSSSTRPWAWPRDNIFLVFFQDLTTPNKSWVSLILEKDQTLFTLLNTSYNGFKTNFIKVSIKEATFWSISYLTKSSPTTSLITLAQTLYVVECSVSLSLCYFRTGLFNLSKLCALFQVSWPLWISGSRATLFLWSSLQGWAQEHRGGHEELNRQLQEVRKVEEENKKKAWGSPTDARITYKQLQHANDDLKLDLQWVGSQCKDLLAKQGKHLVQKATLTKENEMFRSEVYIEHINNFQKVIYKLPSFSTSLLTMRALMLWRWLLIGR